MRGLLVVLMISACTKPMDPAAMGGVTRTGGCAVGESQPCTCGGTSSGSRTCVTPDGLWSACGCASEGGVSVAIPPEPPAPQVCGGVACKAYPQEDSEVGAKGCCTAQGTCGSSSKFLFGTACIERGGHVGAPAPAECPSESIDFVDLEGCCRPDGSCGLTIDAVPNFDLGCLERTAMQKLLNDGAADRNLLTTLSLRAVRPASFAAMACNWRP
ncbi:MAG: hypothetical protein JNM69_32540 [Archangium sp.]|nr:hypothetical protein [Archangium sp.]